mmetsp:Transcript_55204/g.126862  ORF Transcript_55204/g.126862 Transcript_55204/m.126862 type:complete len:267 (+) Transcript_55204:412-1212(+)
MSPFRQMRREGLEPRTGTKSRITWLALGCSSTLYEGFPTLAIPVAFLRMRLRRPSCCLPLSTLTVFKCRRAQHCSSGPALLSTIGIAPCGARLRRHPCRQSPRLRQHKSRQQWRPWTGIAWLRRQEHGTLHDAPSGHQAAPRQEMVRRLAREPWRRGQHRKRRRHGPRLVAARRALEHRFSHLCAGSPRRLLARRHHQRWFGHRLARCVALSRQVLPKPRRKAGHRRYVGPRQDHADHRRAGGVQERRCALEVRRQQQPRVAGSRR